MGRIDDALKRARRIKAVEGPDELSGASGRPGPTPVPPPDLFEPPWQFTPADETPETSRATPGEAPQSKAEPASLLPPGQAASDQRPAGTPAVELPNLPGSDAGPMAPFKRFHPRVAERMVTSSRARPVAVEQYRKVASTLHFAQVERGVKVVMVASAMAGEGKSLTAANLALTLSESYRRQVLLVDADLRRPTLHEIFQVPNVSGLSDGVRAEADAKLTLIQISQHLTLFPAGRPDQDPMAGLISERMRRIVAEAAARFDWVIIDTPPVGLLSDANLLAGMADTVVLVVRAGETPYALVHKAIEALGREKVLGVVLNRAEEGVAYGHRRYYSYYDRYHDRDRKRR